MTAPKSAIYRGWYFDRENSTLDLYFGLGAASQPVEMARVSATVVAYLQPVSITESVLGNAEVAFPVYTTVATPNNQSGMAAYFDTTITGATGGHCYNVGSWINTSGATLTASHIIVPFEGGVYTAEAQANARIVFGGQHMAILAGAPASLHAWRLNTNRTITAVIAAANAGSVGYATGQTATVPSGTIALADVIGTGVVYVQCYTTSS